MKEVFFKCFLESDVILNSNVSTQDSLESLDYIPGSNFLGIVASQLYPKIGDSQKLYDLFHSDKVCFGNAYISDVEGDHVSYPMPLSFMMDKLKSEFGTDVVYLHHQLPPEGIEVAGKRLQLKPQQGGFLLGKSFYIKGAKKALSMKSAYDSRSLSSKDGSLFAYNGLQAGQCFVFSIMFKEEAYLDEVVRALEGHRYIGKSKTAQYGRVSITKLNKEPEKIAAYSNNAEAGVLVYAYSPLCFLNNEGETYNIKASDLGFDNNDAQICWERSQVRTTSYTTWNGKRASLNAQRNCIQKGSVFYVKSNEKPQISQNLVGEYLNEGLGQVLYNPEFLTLCTQNNELDLKYKEIPKEPFYDKQKKDLICVLKDSGVSSSHASDEQKDPETPPKSPETALGKRLFSTKEIHQNELKIAEWVQKTIEGNKKLCDIPSSQWGNIRQLASEATNMEQLDKILFEPGIGHLVRGVAFDRYWRKHFEDFQKILKTEESSPLAVVKLAAEFAKKAKK